MSALLAVITLIALAVAATMGVVAIRIIGAERRRSAARVQALAADIHGLPAPDHASGDRATEHSGAFLPALRFPSTAPAIAAACVVLILVALAVSHVWLSARTDDTPAATAVNGSSAPVPLELLALGNEQTDDHLTVHGVVRNPASGIEVDHLTAVVLLFNQQGAFLTSGRAAVDQPSLDPGSEARFTLTIPGAANVGRYRVSFRNDEQILPHVDRRERK